MKRIHISPFALAVLASISLVSPAKSVVNINWTNIGNPANAADTTGYGAVGYSYSIGTYDVTNAQYVEFLNAKGASNDAGIWNSTMGHTGGTYTYGNITQTGSSGSFHYSVDSTYASNPVVGVTWFDAARFCNWLSNGQGSGSMETGAYTLNGAVSGIYYANPGSQIRLPSEDEWYKAAYYNAVTATYSLYPDGRNTITQVDANYWPSSGLVNVNYGTPSSYGVYGMGGNAWQWNDALTMSNVRGIRGGSWGMGSYSGPSFLASSFRGGNYPDTVDPSLGFRVVSVPEPTSEILAIFAGGMLLIRRKR